MNSLILIFPILLSFVFALYGVPKWIKKCRQTGLLWEDMNKYGFPQNVAGSGGFVVATSFIFGVLSYIAIRTFLIGSPDGTNIEIFALLSVVLILTLIGITDDFLGWKYKGLTRRFRLFSALFASIPLVVINAGISTINFPFVGNLNLGLIYPLFFVPIGVTGAATAYNMLAGFNGLEAGQGIIILSALSFVAYKTGTTWLALVGLIMIAPLLVFYYYNKYPAKVFPGDSLTWTIGALIAVMAILGNFEKIAVFMFLPYIAEVFIKSRGRLKKYSLVKPNKDGSLRLPYRKVYSMTHLSLLILSGFKKKVYEKDVVYLIFALQIVICIFAILIFI